MKDLAYYMSLSYKIEMDEITDEGEHYYKLKIPRLPGVVAFGDTMDEALEELQEGKKVWFQKCLLDKITIPEPINTASSGRVTVRMPKSLHKQLNDFAEEEGVSLNQYIVSLLTQNSVIGIYDKIGNTLLNKINDFFPSVNTRKQDATKYRIAIDAEVDDVSSIIKPVTGIEENTSQVGGIIIES